MHGRLAISILKVYCCVADVTVYRASGGKVMSISYAQKIRNISSGKGEAGKRRCMLHMPGITCIEVGGRWFRWDRASRGLNQEA